MGLLADAQFDVVLNRHCDVNVLETVRVLRVGGYVETNEHRELLSAQRV